MGSATRVASGGPLPQTGARLGAGGLKRDAIYRTPGGRLCMWDAPDGVRTAPPGEPQSFFYVDFSGGRPRRVSGLEGGEFTLAPANWLILREVL